MPELTPDAAKVAQLKKRLAEFQARAAKAAAEASAPGATDRQQWWAESTARDLEQFAAYCSKSGVTSAAAPITPEPTPSPAAAAEPRPAPQPQPVARSREEAIRTIAAGAPFPLHEDAVDEAIASGETVEAFALAVADHCDTERTVARIVGGTPTPPSRLARPAPAAAQDDAEAIARRITAA